MKDIVILLLLLPIFCYSQEKGATKITIQNNLSAKANFDLVVKTLLDNDYFIEAKDAELSTIKTQPKKVNKGYGLHFLNIRALDNEIQVSGMWKAGIEVGGIADNYEPIANKSGLYRAVFANMNALADKLGGNKTFK